MYNPSSSTGLYQSKGNVICKGDGWGGEAAVVAKIPEKKRRGQR
jgi:hypothetical protein